MIKRHEGRISPACSIATPAARCRRWKVLFCYPRRACMPSGCQPSWPMCFLGAYAALVGAGWSQLWRVGHRQSRFTLAASSLDVFLSFIMVMGVVIARPLEIGDDVPLYQGVRHARRHRWDKGASVTHAGRRRRGGRRGQCLGRLYRGCGPPRLAPTRWLLKRWPPVPRRPAFLAHQFSRKADRALMTSAPTAKAMAEKPFGFDAYGVDAR